MFGWASQHLWMATQQCGLVQEHYQREPVWACLLSVPGEWASLQHAELKWDSELHSLSERLLCYLNALKTNCIDTNSKNTHSLQSKSRKWKTSLQQRYAKLTPVQLHDSLSWMVDCTYLAHAELENILQISTLLVLSLVLNLCQPLLWHQPAGFKICLTNAPSFSELQQAVFWAHHTCYSICLDSIWHAAAWALDVVD